MRVSHRAFKCLNARVILPLSTSVSKKKIRMLRHGAYVFVVRIFFYHSHRKGRNLNMMLSTNVENRNMPIYPLFL